MEVKKICAVLLITGVASFSLLAAAVEKKAALPEAPALPAFKALKVYPEKIKINDGRDDRRFLVFGETAGGERFDITGVAELSTEGGAISVSPGLVKPKAAGDGYVKVAHGGLSAKLPVQVQSAEMPKVRFVRDIEPLLSRTGCNAGTCHGSANGKNGFKLSLRGYDPDFDYHALVTDLSGRRFNRVRVDESLMLLKPTGDVPHEGGQAIKPGSKDHELLKQWIAEGTQPEELAVGRANKIDVYPPEIPLDLPGRQQRLVVLAHYADGTSRDVTADAIFSSNNGDVAEVTKDGLVTGIRRGESAIIVKYEGNFGTRLVTVMGDRAGFAWVEPKESNFIDKHVNTKLKKMKIFPSEICTDAEFARRVSLDLTGVIPKSERLKAFLADNSPNKREKYVDELLASKDYIEYWANKWADMLQCNSENLGQKGVWVFRNYIRNSISENKPYNVWVKELLAAKGSSYRDPEVNYLRVLREPGKMTEDISQTFLGVRFNCNKCHDHPFERWTQNQYYEFGAFFAQVGIKRGTAGRETVRSFTGDNIQVAGEEIVFRKLDGGEVKHPKTDKTVAPKVPYGESKSKSEADRRSGFVEWLTSPDNPLFAQSFANRTWSYFFGRGIIDPVDDIRGSNPPSNPELLDALAHDFVENGYDMKKLKKTLVMSQTYQRSILKNEWNEDDTMNFSHAVPRRLSAEQMIDAISTATGSKSKYNGVPSGMRSVELPDGLTGNEFLSLFGRPKRQSACECERTSNVTLSHALNLINGATISDAINQPGNKLAKIVESQPDNTKAVEEIYLSVISRFPTKEEVEAIDLGEGKDRLERAQDLAWALINSPAFLFNR